MYVHDICMCVAGGAYDMVCMCRLEANVMESVLSFHLMDSGYQTWVARLFSKHLSTET